MWKKSPYYRASLYSLALHGTLVILLTVGWIWSPTPVTLMQSPVEVVQATLVSPQQYEQTVKKIEQDKRQALQEINKKEAERVAAEKTAIAAQQRKVEALQQQKIAAEKKQAEQLEAQKIAENKRLEAEQQKIKEAEAKLKQEQEKQSAKRLEEQQKAEALEAEQKKAEAEAELQRKKTEEEKLLQQQLQAEQQEIAAQQQAYVSGELNRFDVMINQKISSVWNFPIDADPTLKVRLTVRVAPDGSVLSASIRESSGHPALDQSALDAVYKASPLPVATDPTVFNEMRNLDIILSPQMRR